MNQADPADTGGEAGLAVRLDSVDESRPDMALEPRNPFQYGGGGGSAPRASGPITRQAPQAPRPVPVTPRIRLRMIGLVDAAMSAGRIAVLTDGDVVLYGREGEVIDGRYRILSVGTSSVEVEAIHGGNRQVLRLAGS